MSIPNCPRLTRTGPSVVTLTVPCFWTEASRPVGGGEVSAAGIPSNYVIRHAPLLNVTLRVKESEWSSVVTFLRAVDDAGISFTFHPDTLVSGTSFTVYLESPSVMNGETITQTRDESDPSILLLPLVLRRSSETAFGLALYP